MCCSCYAIKNLYVSICLYYVSEGVNKCIYVVFKGF